MLRHELRLAAALALGLAGCGDLTHQNPYDPGTPPALQAKATLAGAVTLEAVGTGEPDLTGVLVSVPGTSLTATTDADGRFAITGVDPGRWTVQATKAGYRSATVTGVTVTLDDGNAAVAVPTLELLVARGDVMGRVALQLDVASGDLEASAAGVGVSLSGRPGAAFTDVAGTYQFSGVPVGVYVVTAAKAGFKEKSLQVVEVTEGRTTVLAELVLPPDPGGVGGSVLVLGASDSAGVTVRARGATLSGTPTEVVTLSDAAGAWLISPIPAGSYTVTFEKTDYGVASTSAVVAPGETTTLPGATLQRDTGSLVGTFSLAGAASSAGVVVSLQGGAISTITDATGAFTLSGVPVGSYTVLAAKPPDWQGASVAGVAVARNAATTLTGSPVAIAPVAGASLSGTALAEGVTDALGTAVSLSGVDFRGAAVVRSGSTAASGAWSFGGLVAGSYQVTFSRAGFDTPAPAGVSVVTGQAASLGTVTLAASRGTAAGTVVATGAPSRAGTVVTVSGGPDTASTVTDASGAWRIDGLRVGTGYQATSSRPAYVPQTSATFTIASSTTTPVAPAALAIDATGRLAGVARLERPAAGPFDGTTVTLAGFDVNGAAITGSTTTAADGSYQLAALPEGTYGLSFARSRYDTQALGGLFVAAGTQVTASSVTLPVSRAVVAGTVALDAGQVPGFQVGTDFSGVVVTLSGTDVPIPSVVTDAAGSYRFVDVPVSLAGAAFTVSAGKPFFSGGSASVLAVANATTTVLPIPLSLSDGSLTGTVFLSDNVDGLGDNTFHDGTLVDVRGTAFNGTAYSTVALTGLDGFWDSGPLPPGTYDLTPASTGRACELYKRTVVEPKFANDQGGIRCVDALAPGALALGDPIPSVGADAGYTSAGQVDVPVLTFATDPTLPVQNLRGYELAVGPAPDWARATLVEKLASPFTFTGLAPNARNLLWARAVDWQGNAGTATSAEVVTDSIAPPTPTATTPRVIVSDVSTSVTLSGSEADANFSSYESCSSAVAATAACPGTAPAGCTFATTTANASLALATSQRTCFYARAVDRAGNRSGVARLAVVSDLIPPDAPTVAPLYDPTIFTASADYVDFFITAAAADQPAGQGPWSGVAYLEADTGAGFEPLCPAASCRVNGAFAPCDPGCACTDARRLCRGTELAGIRMPLLGGTANRFSIRAVDLAGNVGSGATQLVNTGTASQLVATTSYDDGVPRTRNGLLTYTGAPIAGVGAFRARLVVLGADNRYDPTDATCELDTPWFNGTYRSHEPINTRTVIHVGGSGRTLNVRRAGADGVFCTADDAADVVLRDTGVATLNIPAAGGSMDPGGTRERVAWSERNTGVAPFQDAVYVREPGANRTLDLVDDTVVTIAGPFTNDLVNEVSLGGNVLLYRRISAGYTVVTATTGLFTGPLQTLSLPAGTISAALDTTGSFVTWVANDPAITIHHLTPGLDGIFGTGDDVERTRTLPNAPQLLSAGMAVEGGHVIVAETFVGSGPAYVDHWYAGGDGRYGTADDQLSRVLPSSRPRNYPALAGGVAAGTAYLQVGLNNTIGENVDLVAVDLSARRWEVAGATALSTPRPNGEGTLFYNDGTGAVFARTSDGREWRGWSTSSFAADGATLYYGSGAGLYRSAPDANGRWFQAPQAADPLLFSRLAPGGLIEAGDGYLIAQTTEAVGGFQSVSLLRNVAGTWTATRLDDTVGTFTEFLSSFGMGVSSRHAAWSCRVPFTSPELACFRSAGADGILGTDDDVSGRVKAPGGADFGQVVAVRVSGSKVMLTTFRGGAYHLVVVSPGAAGHFGGVDNTEVDLGPVTEFGAGFYDFRGNMVAWSQVVASFPGTQTFVHDLRDGTRRQLTTHYSLKPEVRVEPSGRVYWTDSLLQAQAIFVSAP